MWNPFVKKRLVIKFAVTGGSFAKDKPSCFDDSEFSLFLPKADAPEIRYAPEQLKSFTVKQGEWSDLLSDSTKWLKALTAAAAVSTPIAVTQTVAKEVFPFQNAILSWTNGMIGASAAVAVMNSDRTVTFEAQFRDKTKLKAEIEERALTVLMPRLLNVKLQSSDGRRSNVG